MKTVTIELPEELFGDGATAERIHPVKMKHVAQVGKIQTKGSVGFDEMCELMSQLYPRWSGVLDPDTGKPLPNPEDAEDGTFSELLPEQYYWFGGKGLAERPI